MFLCLRIGHPDKVGIQTIKYGQVRPGLERLPGTLAGGEKTETSPYGRPVSELNRRPWTNHQGVTRVLP
jgi:hypothetical protein